MRAVALHIRRRLARNYMSDQRCLIPEGRTLAMGDKWGMIWISCAWQAAGMVFGWLHKQEADVIAVRFLVLLPYIGSTSLWACSLVFSQFCGNSS
jgi:hypothetical protein